MTEQIATWIPGNHYDLLGLRQDASVADIDDAYDRAKARCGTRAGRFLLRWQKSAVPADLDEARRVLKDPASRAAHDRALADQVHGHLWHPPCW